MHGGPLRGVLGVSERETSSPADANSHTDTMSMKRKVCLYLTQTFTDAAAGKGYGARGDLTPGDALAPPEHRRRGGTMLKLSHHFPPPSL